jgi:hypothetical protein
MLLSAARNASMLSQPDCAQTGVFLVDMMNKEKQSNKPKL